MNSLFLVLVSALLLAGCVTPTGPQDPSALPTVSQTREVTASTSPTTASTLTPIATQATPEPTATPGGSTVQPTAASTPDHGPPTTRTSARPSNPDRGEPFTLTLSAEDDVGVKMLSWESADAFSKQPESNSFDCGTQKNCSVSWEFISAQNGTKKITVYATDSANQNSARVPVEITVRPFDFKPTPVPVCGNGVCEKSETNSSCAQDCAPKTSCGNGVCESGETTSSCAADCPAASPTQKACSSNSACGYKQICQSGKCVSVDCTNDAQCGYAKECENNRCVRCPSGPYGPAC